MSMYLTRLSQCIDRSHFCTLSHFHLDHCGALPFMSEMVGYDGPIYMTHPTKAICPILLEDFRKITVDKKGETNFFTSQMIKDCMKKVVPLNLHQTVQVLNFSLSSPRLPLVPIDWPISLCLLCCWQVDDELEIKAYYAGHVLGAAMVHIKVGSESVVYTVSVNKPPMCCRQLISLFRFHNNVCVPFRETII